MKILPIFHMIVQISRKFNFLEAQGADPHPLPIPEGRQVKVN
jgi:hypothetical protein